MKKITAYKTTDGSIFEEEHKAIDYEFDSIVRANISKFFKEMDDGDMDDLRGDVCI